MKQKSRKLMAGYLRASKSLYSKPLCLKESSLFFVRALFAVSAAAEKMSRRRSSSGRQKGTLRRT